MNNDKTYFIKNPDEVDITNPLEFSVIPEFDQYVINCNGEIWSLYKRMFIYGIVASTGFITVALKKDKKQNSKTIHKILATLFIPNPNNYQFVEFIDKNKENIKLDNLKWVEKRVNGYDRRNYARK